MKNIIISFCITICLLACSKDYDNRKSLEELEKEFLINLIEANPNTNFPWDKDDILEVNNLGDLSNIDVDENNSIKEFRLYFNITTIPESIVNLNKLERLDIQNSSIKSDELYNVIIYIVALVMHENQFL